MSFTECAGCPHTNAFGGCELETHCIRTPLSGSESRPVPAPHMPGVSEVASMEAARILTDAWNDASVVAERQQIARSRANVAMAAKRRVRIRGASGATVTIRVDRAGAVTVADDGPWQNMHVEPHPSLRPRRTYRVTLAYAGRGLLFVDDDVTETGVTGP